MGMAAIDFLDALEIDVPETRPIIDHHFKNHDWVLLHVLTADLRRYSIRSFDAGQSEVLGRLLAVLDRALREGSDDVQDAMTVSFVEETGCWDSAMQPFIETWPAGLRAEVDRQRP